MLILLIILNFSSLAKSKEVLKCLGQEELRYHNEKYTGAKYQLNQRLISLFLQVPKLQPNNSTLMRICYPGAFSSWILLKEMVVSPDEWANEELLDEELIKSLHQELNAQALKTFISYISLLQSNAPTPHCIEKKVPGMSEFFVKIKYLQDEIEMRKILPPKRELRSLLDKLDHPLKLYQACQEN